MAFKVPGEFSDVFIGSVHSMSCVLWCQGKFGVPWGADVGAIVALPQKRCPIFFGLTRVEI